MTVISSLHALFSLDRTPVKLHSRAALGDIKSLIIFLILRCCQSLWIKTIEQKKLSSALFKDGNYLRYFSYIFLFSYLILAYFCLSTESLLLSLGTSSFKFNLLSFGTEFEDSWLIYVIFFSFSFCISKVWYAWLHSSLVILVLTLASFFSASCFFFSGYFSWVVVTLVLFFFFSFSSLIEGLNVFLSRGLNELPPGLEKGDKL